MSDDGSGVSEKPLINGYANLFNLIKLANGKRVALFAHSYPDPDALGSMMGLQWVLSKFNIQSDLFLCGEISHPQNMVFVNIIDPGLKKIQEYEKLSEGNKYSHHILLDTIPQNAGIGKCKVTFDVVIDHHRDLPDNDYQGIVVHKKCGSCCSIVYDIAKHLLKKDENWFDADNEADQRVATALLSGIITDTDTLMSNDTTNLEFSAYQELFPFRNPLFLKQIVSYKRPRFWIISKAEACKSHDCQDGIAVYGLGSISSKQRDLIADTADEMSNWENIKIAIAFAVVDGKEIVGSIRSFDPSTIVADLAKILGGELGRGGGKQNKGAYVIPLGGFSFDEDDEDEEDLKKAWEVIKERETKRIFRNCKK